MQKLEISDDAKCHFIDLWPYSPNFPSSMIDYTYLMQHVVTQEHLDDFIVRLRVRLRQYHPTDGWPIIYLCGPEVGSLVMPLLADLQPDNAELGVFSTTSIDDQRECQVVIKGDHPSAHLMSRGDPTKRAIFKTTMHLLKSLATDSDLTMVYHEAPQHPEVLALFADVKLFDLVNHRWSLNH